MPHVKLGKYLRFYKSELLRYIGRTSARFGQQGLRSYDQTRYSTPPCKGKSEAQEKGRCLWFNQVVPTTTASPRRAGVQGSRSFLESITSSQSPRPTRHFPTTFRPPFRSSFLPLSPAPSADPSDFTWPRRRGCRGFRKHKGSNAGSKSQGRTRAAQGGRPDDPGVGRGRVPGRPRPGPREEPGLNL